MSEPVSLDQRIAWWEEDDRKDSAQTMRMDLSRELITAYRQQAKQIEATRAIVEAAEAWAKWVPHRDGMTDFLKLEKELAIAVKSYHQAIKAFREE